MEFELEWVLHLWFLVPVAVLVWALLRRRNRLRYARIFDEPLRQRYSPAPKPLRFLAQLVGLTLALSLALMALARPRWGQAREVVVRRQRDLVMVLDVSRSMLANDVFPNRLERAKALLHDLVRSSRHDRIAIVAFRGGARRLCPLTRDTGYLLQTLAGMDIHSAPPGPTDIGMAIRMACAAFDQETPGRRTVLLISDGEDLGGSIDPALEEARRQGVVFLCVGIGTTTGAPIPDTTSPTGEQQFEGQRVITRLEHATLSRIAIETGGAYIPLADGIADLDTLYNDQLRPSDARETSQDVIRQTAERFQWFLLPAVVCLLGIAFLSRGRTGRRRVGGGLLLLLLLGANLTVRAVKADPGMPERLDAAPTPRPAREALQAYRDGNYAAAATGFETAAATTANPRRQATLLYNAAIAHYRAGNFDAAAQRFEEILHRDGIPGTASRHHLAAAQLASAAEAGEDRADAAAAATLHQALQQAASLAQQALLEDPRQDAWRSTLNALDHRLEQAAEHEHWLRIFEQHGERSPAELATDILQRQRALRHDLDEADRQPLPERLRQRESLALKQRETADLLLPLAPALQNDPDGMRRAGDAAQALRTAADAIADADDRAAAKLQDGESIFYGLWKDLADYRQLLDEALTQQADAAATVTELQERAVADIPAAIVDQQLESHDLNQRFQQHLRQAPDLVPPPESPFTDAQAYREHLLQLAQSAAQAQDTATAHLNNRRLSAALPAQREAADLLSAIRDLLPPPPPSETQDSDSSPPEQDPDNGENENDDENENDAQTQPAADAPEDTPPDESEAAAREQSPDELDPDRLETLLDRIQQRERDYLEAQRQRARHTAVSDRDW